MMQKAFVQLPKHLVVDDKWRLHSWLVVQGAELHRNQRVAVFKSQSGATEYAFAPCAGTLSTVTMRTDTPIDGDVSNIAELTYCPHSVVFKGVCAVCGKDAEPTHFAEAGAGAAPSRLPVAYNATSLSVTRAEAESVSSGTARRLFESRRLSLVLDLDHTLLHATDEFIIAHMLQHASPDADVSSINTFLLHNASDATVSQMFVKLRPFLREFLQRAAKKFQLHIYTMGSRPYADKIASLIDPDKQLFSGRITSREDFSEGRLNQKSIQRLFPCDDSMVLIVDDREDVWIANSKLDFMPNLVRAQPYVFWNELPVHDRRELYAVFANCAPPIPDGRDPYARVHPHPGHKKNATVTAIPQQQETQQPINPLPKDQADAETELSNSEENCNATNDKQSDQSLKENNLTNGIHHERNGVNGKCKKPKYTKCCPCSTRRATSKDDSCGKAFPPNGTSEIVLKAASDQVHMNGNEHDPEESSILEVSGHEEHRDSLQRNGETKKIDPTNVTHPADDLRRELSTEKRESVDHSGTNGQTVTSKQVCSDSGRASLTETLMPNPDSRRGKIEMLTPPKGEIQPKDGGGRAVEGDDTNGLTPDAVSATKQNGDQVTPKPANGESHEMYASKAGNMLRHLLQRDAQPEKSRHLLRLADVLEECHSRFFRACGSSEATHQTKRASPGRDFSAPADVKNILGRMRSKILTGCHLTFSCVIPTGTNPEVNRTWKLARRLGAKCSPDFVNGQTTHLVVRHPNMAHTQKMKDVLRAGTAYVVAMQWLDDCSLNFEKRPEILYTTESLAREFKSQEAYREAIQTRHVRACSELKRPQESSSNGLGEHRSSKRRRSDGVYGEPERSPSPDGSGQLASPASSGILVVSPDKLDEALEEAFDF